jgi:hydroxymethylpyrimidine/phosphomethylpyrimidine kinase
MQIALTIAGSDSSAGAGLQADLKTFAAHGMYAGTAVTAITAQHTGGVCRIADVDPQLVRAQIEALAGDFRIAAVKTGMLSSAAIVACVAATIRRLRLPNVVVDPVISAGDGSSLLAADGLVALKEQLLPLADVVTPNAAEAARIAAMDVRNLDDAREAASRIHNLGPRVVIVKGGHLEGPDAVDLVYDGSDFHQLSAPRIPGPSPHGTGCTFASAVAANLANGHPPLTAAARAKVYVTGAIDHRLHLARGGTVLDHFWNRGL